MQNIFAHWRGDVMGGLTTAVVALPLCLAFGAASGMGAASGLYSAIILGFFAALFGGSGPQVSGPNGPMTVVMASVVAQFPGQPAMCFAAVMLAGVFLVIGGWLRLGRLMAYVPHGVLSGFMTGVGLIIIILQLATLSGHSSFANIMGVLNELPSYWATPNWQAAALGGLTLLIVVFYPKSWGLVVPSPLAALLIGTALGMAFFPAAPVIGAIPSSLPNLLWPALDVGQWALLLPSALMLATLCAVDSLMTATVADTMTQQRHQPNRELIAQGIGNFLAGLAGGIAGSGATMRTTVNIQAGGLTRLSGMTHALILLTVLVCLAPFAAHIPHAVLGGILLKVGFDIIDWPVLRRATTLPRFELVLIVLVIILTLVMDLLVAVVAGSLLAMAQTHWQNRDKEIFYRDNSDNGLQ